MPPHVLSSIRCWLRAFALGSDWFSGLTAFVVIAQGNNICYFNLGFTTLTALLCMTWSYLVDYCSPEHIKIYSKKIRQRDRLDGE